MYYEIRSVQRTLPPYCAIESDTLKIKAITQGTRTFDWKEANGTVKVLP